ncbi:hypothetical protein D9M69_308830 [compost metagenome]
MMPVSAASADWRPMAVSNVARNSQVGAELFRAAVEVVGVGWRFIVGVPKVAGLVAARQRRAAFLVVWRQSVRT